MAITNVNSEINSYIHNFLRGDLQKIHTDALSEISKSNESEVEKIVAIRNPFEIKDEYIPHIKPKVEVTLEERLEQVISPEEIKNLLSLIVRGPRIFSTPGQLVDVKG